MEPITLALVLFVSGYFLNLFYISLFYHRGIAHTAVTLAPWLKKIIVVTGNWITGLDPKAWSCMHRLHHAHSDTEKDPHSPKNGGIFRVMVNQLHSYENVLRDLKSKNSKLEKHVQDLDFPVNWLNRKRLWYLPYLLHALIGISISLATQTWYVGLAYWFGIMSHPIQGWMVNAFGHSMGYRNFDLPDDSTNNTFVAWTVMGEGFQNNHHKFPNSPKFSVKWWEVDYGYGICLILNMLGILKINPIGRRHPSLSKTA